MTIDLVLGIFILKMQIQNSFTFCWGTLVFHNTVLLSRIKFCECLTWKIGKNYQGMYTIFLFIIIRYLTSNQISEFCFFL
jgi:hypothetical protein